MPFYVPAAAFGHMEELSLTNFMVGVAAASAVGAAAFIAKKQ